MMFKNQQDRYATAAIFLHWLTLLLIVLVYVCINVHGMALKGSAFRASMKYWHYIFGLSVLATVVLRLLVKMEAGPIPSITPAVDPWVRRASHVFHLFLYAFLIGMPLLGWVAISAGDKTIPFHLPALIAPDKALYAQLKEIHETIGRAGYYLIGLHAVITLAHHYVMRDDTLKRMLPRWIFPQSR